MNESHNGISTTRQAMREVSECTHTMNGNDMTENTRLQQHLPVLILENYKGFKLLQHK